MPKRGEAAIDPKWSNKQKAIAALVAMLATWEGLSLVPYQDVVGVWTVCYGETRIPMRTYTKAECDELLRKESDKWLEDVAATNPGIRAYPMQHAAHASLAYNVGLANYRRSSTRRLFIQGRRREACAAIGKWRLAGGKVWRGLVLRRNGDAARLGEIELCKKDAA